MIAPTSQRRGQRRRDTPLSIKIEKRVVAVEVATTADVAVLDGTNAADLIVRFNAAKKAMKELKAEKEAVEAELRALLGDATVGTIEGIDRAFIQSISREGIDRDTLARDFSEAYEATRTTTTYTVLKTV